MLHGDPVLGHVHVDHGPGLHEQLPQQRLVHLDQDSARTEAWKLLPSKSRGSFRVILYVRRNFHVVFYVPLQNDLLVEPSHVYRGVLVPLGHGSRGHPGAGDSETPGLGLELATFS